MQELQNQLSIEALITAPLVAASKANVVMVNGQTKALLENCFRKKGEIYEPIKINMSLTRGFLQSETSSPEAGFIKPYTLTFSVPLLCLVPINNIVVDKVNVQFDMEITAVAPKEQKPLLPGITPVVDDKAVLLGKISNKPSTVREGQQSQQSSHLKVNINAGPLPLPLGLLTVLELYSKSIQPVEFQTTADTTSGF
ncbi:MAG: DUF2589 domain-containing protein [Terriglobia bacterium]